MLKDFSSIFLNDNDQRERLEKVKVEDATGDELFQRAKKTAWNFQRGLSKLFFETNPELTHATQTYGVF